MLLTIAIASYKNPEMLRLCLRESQREIESADAEILVADSETQEETEMMMREDFPDIRFFSNTGNIGFGALVNICLKHARGKYILLLNSDILLCSGSVHTLLECVQSDDSIGMIGPKLLNFDGTAQYSVFRFYKPITILFRRTFLKIFPFAKKHLAWFLMNDKDLSKKTDVDWLMGSAMLVRRDAVEKVGVMDTRFFMYMEDVDWCRRFWKNGFRVVYCPRARAYHYHGKASARGGFIRSLLCNRLTWIHIASAVKYFWKYRGKITERTPIQARHKLSDRL